VREQRGRAIVDIFRLENGKIEHWDVAQEIERRPPMPTGCSSGDRRYRFLVPSR
jgi:hypothetical protein